MRYEIKLVLDPGKLAEFLLWMNKATTAKPIFYPRHVNSLYFDNLEYQAVRDNLTGISDRKKIRLRWYHQDDQYDILGFALEIKRRNGRLGDKQTLKLPELKSLMLEKSLGDIFPLLSSELLNTPDMFTLLEEHQSPTLHVNYLREYFVDTHGIRITIDKDIKFYPITPLSKLYDSPPTAYPMYVAEIKFDPAQKMRVAQMMRSLGMTPKRHSKYLAGMASLGQALYI